MERTRKFNEDNERIKRSYLRYLRNAKGYSENTVNKAADAILRLEKATDFEPFKALNIEGVEKFRDHLTSAPTGKTGKPMGERENLPTPLNRLPPLCSPFPLKTPRVISPGNPPGRTTFQGVRHSESTME